MDYKNWGKIDKVYDNNLFRTSISNSSFNALIIKKIDKVYVELKARVIGGN